MLPGLRLWRRVDIGHPARREIILSLLHLRFATTAFALAAIVVLPLGVAMAAGNTPSTDKATTYAACTAGGKSMAACCAAVSGKYASGVQKLNGHDATDETCTFFSHSAVSNKTTFERYETLTGQDAVN